jgi:hypothetical protein
MFSERDWTYLSLPALYFPSGLHLRVIQCSQKGQTEPPKNMARIIGAGLPQESDCTALIGTLAFLFCNHD